jgi:nicotinate-nucleotide adenylyltransferase
MHKINSAAPPNARRRRRIGLLGGSFNPAHDGHRYISLLALKRLALDEVWWLVSPQNPLKASAGMAELASRLDEARAVARHRRIVVSDIERRLGTRFTADTLAALGQRYPRHAFVWLMGADNLAQIEQWKDWPKIFNSAPIAVIDRSTYSYRALAGKAARRFRRARLDTRRAKSLAAAEPPAWVFIRGKPHPASATGVRNARARQRNGADGAN